MSKKGTLYFFTGLAGAGKTTIGNLFYERLRTRKNNVIFRDGDQMRADEMAISIEEGVPLARDYSLEDRLKGARATCPWCKEITDQGIDIVFCTISMFDEIRDWYRENLENYKEIYVKVSLETLYRRDQKNLYHSDIKNVVGKDLPYEEPKTPDIVIENEGQETPEEIAARIEQILFGEL